MNPRTLKVNDSSLHYKKTGTGPSVLLAFHGFGQDHQVFESLTHNLPEQYTLYLFDLFFHGKSWWAHGEEPLEKEHWKEFIAVFLKDNQIEKFSVAGFSLGAKFVLATLESFSEKIEKLFLIAPDGIKTSFWYSLATYPRLLRRFFKSMILHPNRFLMLAKFAYTWRLADRGLLRFAEYQMNTKEKRSQVYHAWVVFRHLKFDMMAIVKILNNHHIPLTLILGAYDKVITRKNVDHLLTQLTNFNLEIIQTGHNGLLDKNHLAKFLIP